MQERKESFLTKARAGQTDDYLKSTRTAPLSRYEIKAGWEIPAILEQALNSDLPGELKALVSSNVYDTATGRFLLIPQGARLVGVYNSRIGYGQDGVQAIWDRVIYPDGSSLDLSGNDRPGRPRIFGLPGQGRSPLQAAGWLCSSHEPLRRGIGDRPESEPVVAHLPKSGTGCRQRRRPAGRRSRRTDYPAKSERPTDNQDPHWVPFQREREPRRSV